MKSATCLRIFRGDGADGAAAQHAMSLGEFFRRVFLPRLSPAPAPRNVEQYEESVALWALYTGDPPLTQVDDRVAEAFVDHLSRRTWRGQPIGCNTIRKHCVHLQAVLDFAGPEPPGSKRKSFEPLGLFGFRSLAYPDREHWLPRNAPVLPKPPADPGNGDPRGVFTLAEVGQWLAACRFAWQPPLRDVRPEIWWRSLIVWSYNVGTRIGTTLALRWEMLQDDWIDIPAEALKGRRRGQRLPLNRFAREAAEAMRPAADPRIFPWPYTHRWLQSCRRRLLARTPIPPERRFGFHGLRKCLATELWKVDPGAAQKALGHASPATTLRHYVGVCVLSDPVRRLDQPTVDPQQTLF